MFVLLSLIRDAGNPRCVWLPSRQYSSTTAPDAAKFAGAGGRTAANITALLKDYDPDLERRVYWAIPGTDRLRRPKCGDFYLHVDVWYRKTPWIPTGGPDGKEFIEYLTSSSRSGCRTTT
jgi:hypothetical protein